MNNMYNFKLTAEDIVKLKECVVNIDESLDPTNMVYITTRNTDRIKWNTKVTDLFKSDPRFGVVCVKSIDTIAVRDYEVVSLVRIEYIY